jgi:hypothetical protein
MKLRSGSSISEGLGGELGTSVMSLSRSIRGGNVRQRSVRVRGSLALARSVGSVPTGPLLTRPV